MYRSWPAAWIVTLWALREHRPLAHPPAPPRPVPLPRCHCARRADGWSYDPDGGWFHTAPGCADGSCAPRPAPGR